MLPAFLCQEIGFLWPMKGFSFTMRLHMLSGHGAASTCCLRDHLRRKTEFVTSVHSSIHRLAFVTATLCAGHQFTCLRLKRRRRPGTQLDPPPGSRGPPPEAGINRRHPAPRAGQLLAHLNENSRNGPASCPPPYRVPPSCHRPRPPRRKCRLSGSDKQDWNRAGFRCRPRALPHSERPR